MLGTVNEVLTKAEVGIFVNPFRCEIASGCLNMMLRFFLYFLCLSLDTRGDMLGISATGKIHCGT